VRKKLPSRSASHFCRFKLLIVMIFSSKLINLPDIVGHIARDGEGTAYLTAETKEVLYCDEPG